MKKSVNTVRSLAIDSIEKANSGHPGICMGAAPMAYTLFNHHLITDTKNPNWINRDRFVLSAGHGSALLYSLIHLSGFGLTIQDLKQFRKAGSKTPGHPENFETKGIDISTGPLGQGFASAVGLAMAEKFLAAKINKKDYNIIDHNVFVICGDGDLMEGISYEASSLAGHHKLEKLVVLYDSNDISLDGELSVSFSENINKRFEAQGWEVFTVLDGEDTLAISEAIRRAKKSSSPTLIEIKTVIGYGADKKAGTSAAHGAPLGKEELKYAKEQYEISQEPFHVDIEVYEDFEENIISRGNEKHLEWKEMVSKFEREYQKEAFFLKRLEKNKAVDFIMPTYTDNVASRIASQYAIQQIAEIDELFLGGSADLSCSNNTIIKTDGKFGIDSDVDRNIFFGVREFAMGAILNGMALHSGLKVYGSTFMVFSDYLKPAIRLAALMKLPVTYVFTHDSIAVGEDGPTHQPVEQLAMFRSMPNTNVIRPCDANETQAAWKLAYESTETPTILALTRQNLPQISSECGSTVLANVKRGGYIIYETKNYERIIIASGSEVAMAIEVAKELEKLNINSRVVSMPCQEFFDVQPEAYRNEVLPPHIRTRYAIEMASSFGWEKYTFHSKNVFGIDRFGMSGNADEIMELLNYTVNDIVNEIVNS